MLTHIQTCTHLFDIQVLYVCIKITTELGFHGCVLCNISENFICVVSCTKVAIAIFDSGMLFQDIGIIFLFQCWQYTNGESWGKSVYSGLCEKLLWKFQTLVGFFLNHHVRKWQPAVQRLYRLYNSGELKITIDPAFLIFAVSGIDWLGRSSRCSGSSQFREGDSEDSIK
ncbi:hypothetical protein KP509_01G120900 [Ceratopteris richardii]|uniref:Uncharacterized protein n=1 Tax=Ceratopteris richardii TaxID=49495 RepID=A0A8T2VGY2_CERRI|nr:hypothetical protein KP509_01G120900 [Ceratopteris richardii]